MIHDFRFSYINNNISTSAVPNWCERMNTGILGLDTAPVQAETECQPRQNNSNHEASYSNHRTRDCPTYNETIDLQDMVGHQNYKQFSFEGRERVKVLRLIGSDYLFRSCIHVYAQVSDEFAKNRFYLEVWHKINSVNYQKYENERKDLKKGQLNSECTERTVSTERLDENVINQEQTDIEVELTLSETSVRYNHRTGNGSLEIDTSNTSATDDDKEIEMIDSSNVIQTDKYYELSRIPLDDISDGEYYYNDNSRPLGYDDTVSKSFNTWSRGIMANDPWEFIFLKDEGDHPVCMGDADKIVVTLTLSESVGYKNDDGCVENKTCSTDNEEEGDEIHDADNVIQTERYLELSRIPLDDTCISDGEYYNDNSRPLGNDDTEYRTFNTWCRGMTANDPWELACPNVEEDYPVWMSDADDIGEEERFGQFDGRCNIVDGWSVTDYKSSYPMMSDMTTQDLRRVYLFQEPDGATSINVVEGSATSDAGQSFSSSFLVSCLSLVNFTQKLKKKVPSDVEVDVPLKKSPGTWTLEKPRRPRMTMNNITLKEVAWLLIALVASIAGSAAAFSPNYTAKTLKNVLIDSATSKDGLLGLGRVELKNIICDEASKIWRKPCTPLEDGKKILYKLGGTLPWGCPKKDFLRDVLNVPDCIQPPLQIMEVYPVFEQRGYEDEFTRLASFSRCPEQQWYPAVPLAENGFYFEPESSVICNFCKSKSNTWQRDWDPKLKHERDCPFLNGNDCGNFPMEPSRENGAYQPAIQSALDELQMQQLQNKNKVLLRNSTRSVESFKNPQIPPENQMGSLSINVTQGQGRQEHDAMEDEPQPSTSNANSSQQQQEGAGGLRYFVHSYDNSGRPVSTSQKMEFNSNEEKANTSMKKETDRLKSFDSVWKKGDVISPQELAKSGFYYAGTGDRVRCAFCNGVLRNWAVGDRAAAEHRRHYPTCPFVLNLNVGNIPSNPDLSDLHTSTAATTNHTEQKRPAARTPGQQSAQRNFGAAVTPSAVPGTILIPKHSNFSTVESRLLTYDSWPSSNVQRPNELAEAGFFYTGSSDNVRCFHCDGGLRNWLDSDMPWIEHAKWFPRCGFLQRVKGVEFVLEETRKHNQQNFTTALAQTRGSTGLATTPTQGVGIVERPSTGGVRRVEAREVRARFDTDRVKMVLDMGYKEAVVKYVILQRLRYTGDDFPSTQEMLESVLAEEPNLEEKGIAYYEKILQQEFGRPMTIVYPQLPGGKSDKTAVPSPAPPMTQTTSASLVIPEDEKSLVEENRQLKEQTTCKICMDNEVSMVFVPCGHLVACADCAPNLRECPICRRKITGTIRTFLS